MRTKHVAPQCNTFFSERNPCQPCKAELVRLWSLGELSNKGLCTICWYASQAGADGVSDLGLDPSKRGGNHARHIRDRLGLIRVRQQLYYVRVPMWNQACVSNAHGTCLAMIHASCVM
jgi:hypothetical protein